jgi:hypothetical protein
MSCSGLHCAGCSAGVSVPPLALAATLGLAWVVEHLAEVAAVSAACGVLSVVTIVALLRWADRRDGRHAARGSLFVTRADVIPLAATVIPQVTQAERPAIPQAVIFNFYSASPMAARAFHQIPGPSGDVTEGK